MKIKIKPKKFGPVYVSIDRERHVLYGTTADAVEQTAPPVTSPADCLLYSLGACIAISLQMAAEQEKLVLDPFQVEISSKKAENLPSRFGSFEIVVPHGLTDDAALSQKLLTKAKGICTVSNTLNADIALRFSD